MPERPIGIALKAIVGKPTGGSNPSPSAQGRGPERVADDALARTTYSEPPISIDTES